MIINIDEVIAKIEEVSDPIDKIRLVGDALAEVANLTAELGRYRREEIETLIAGGMSQNEVGRQIGLTSARVSQLLTKSPAPERAFFGAKSQPVIVAMAQKVEGEKTNPGPVVSSYDLKAWDKLRGLLDDFGLRSSYEEVLPPGNVRLNREGLVLICGPRNSSLIAQVLESDDRLGFAKEETGKSDTGWHLVDHEAGISYHSPEDSGEPGDIAYFGRLPRPDGKGHFLYIAGIHAAGAAGVVHYIQHELGSLYREVRNKRFSMLISCTYDPVTREVTSSKRVTPIYKHEG